MTKTQFRKKVRGLMQDTRKSLLKECDELFDHGGADPAKFGDDYALPKIVLCVALQNLSIFWLPPDDNYKKELRNLRRYPI